MSNIYKEARLRAARRKSSLETLNATARQLGINREKLGEIEQDDPKKKRSDPDVNDVMNMVKLYDAPELYDYYCTNQCPLKQGKNLMHTNLGEISSSLMSAIHFLTKANDDIHKILGDSKVTELERGDFNKILKTLNDIAYSAESLKLWAEKNHLVDKK